jgi:hypothetical protein
LQGIPSLARRAAEGRRRVFPYFSAAVLSTFSARPEPCGKRFDTFFCHGVSSQTGRQRHMRVRAGGLDLMVKHE